MALFISHPSAISHQFAQRQTAIKWLVWLHRKQAIWSPDTGKYEFNDDHQKSAIVLTSTLLSNIWRDLDFAQLGNIAVYIPWLRCTASVVPEYYYITKRNGTLFLTPRVNTDTDPLHDALVKAAATKLKIPGNTEMDLHQRVSAGLEELLSERPELQVLACYLRRSRPSPHLRVILGSLGLFLVYGTGKNDAGRAPLTRTGAALTRIDACGCVIDAAVGAQDLTPQPMPHTP
ncbi:hypothetical protein B0H13DRAFT_1906522 [Mycena leptocephala]|nr:hypothetical protein B0H13DRAFT_1906522 [Mycena leptocephala]